ncbi:MULTISPECIES: trimeric intracellular cation channel family protein [Eikenella]|uniref:Glycine transporter domain-containing protein n=1 Tax=Eikenella longinqua TaxID=1795827 RepID=A0A1A9S145_9NEIS|nr:MULTISPECIES: trimeric intracellular cation channel family protein [Eikenella]OAM31150.1 hypothetical protein A7P95_01210 [Eikenella longinqua]
MTSTDFIQIIGTAAFAVSGYLVGYGKRLDVLGVIITALLTAVGGGMMRDALVGQIPQVFQHTDALIVVFATLALAWLLRLQRYRRTYLAAAFLIADAIGLAAFSITGAQIGIGLHLNLFGVIVLAFVTAVGGGIARDILVNDVPIVLRADLYGSVAILIGGLMYLFARLGWINAFTLHLLFAAGLFLRLAAYRFHWQLPGFQPHRRK